MMGVPPERALDERLGAQRVVDDRRPGIDPVVVLGGVVEAGDGARNRLVRLLIFLEAEVAAKLRRGRVVRADYGLPAKELGLRIGVLVVVRLSGHELQVRLGPPVEDVQAGRVERRRRDPAHHAAVRETR
jgi:hypothetical protein